MIYSAIKEHKINFAFVLLGLLLAILIGIIDRGVWGPGKIWLWVNLFSAVINAYVVFSPGKNKELDKNDEYSSMIGELSSMTANLSKLKGFLETEQKKIIDTKEFIAQLGTNRGRC